MIRLTATAALIALLAGTPAHALSLKATISAGGEVVRLGDFFTGAGEHADVALFRAPAPGADGVVSTDRLRQAVRRLGISWAPPYGLLQVQVTRPIAGRPHEIAPATIERRLLGAIADALPGAAAPEDVAITLGPGAPEIALEGDGTHVLDVVRLDIDPRHQTFEAVVEVTEAAGSRAVTFAGSYERPAEVAVLAVDVSRGEIIGRQHLTTIRATPDEARLAVSVEDIAGKAARRRMRAGTQPRLSDVEEPMVIERNELVTIFFQVPGLTLTTQGRALEAAAAGEAVAVRNVTSNRVVQATADGRGRVSVGAPVPTHLAMR